MRIDQVHSEVKFTSKSISLHFNRSRNQLNLIKLLVFDLNLDVNVISI